MDTPRRIFSLFLIGYISWLISQLGTRPVFALELPHLDTISISYKFQPSETFETQFRDLVDNSRFAEFDTLAIGMYLDLNRAIGYSVIGTQIFSYRSISIDLGLTPDRPVLIGIAHINVLSLLTPNLGTGVFEIGVGVAKKFRQ